MGVRPRRGRAGALPPRGRRTRLLINPDEGINHSIISQPTLAACWGELANNTHPPLTSVVMWLMSLVSSDHTWLPMASLASGGLAIFGAYLASRELGSKPGSVCGLSGLVAATLIAISPFAIDQSQLIRPYMLQFALLTFAIWFLTGGEKAVPGHPAWEMHRGLRAVQRQEFADARRRLEVALPKVSFLDFAVQNAWLILAQLRARAGDDRGARELFQRIASNPRFVASIRREAARGR